MAVNKNTPSTATFVKYIGTTSFNEYSKGITVLSDGSVFSIGQISANGFTNGNSDILITGLTKDGTTKYVEYMGATIIETAGDIVYNTAAK